MEKRVTEGDWMPLICHRIACPVTRSLVTQLVNSFAKNEIRDMPCISSLV